MSSLSLKYFALHTQAISATNTPAIPANPRTTDISLFLALPTEVVVAAEADDADEAEGVIDAVLVTEAPPSVRLGEALEDMEPPGLLDRDDCAVPLGAVIEVVLGAV